jgi:predicted ATP-grasp superfamily ATP-dependent carboligase
MSSGTNRALVFGADSQIGLTICRELAEHGVEVYAIGNDRRAVGLHSRAVKKGWVRTPGEEPIAMVNRVAAEFTIPLMLVVGENNINYFNERRQELRGIRALIPESAVMQRVLDKSHVCAIAEQLGIEIPRTLVIRTPDEIAGVVSALTYPVVLKWANPHAVITVLREHRVRLEKTRYCYSAEELSAHLHTFDPVGAYPMVQSFAAGHGLGQMVFMHRGQAVLRFQHRRLHEWPPEGGASSLCESLAPDAHADLMEKSIALLQRLEWEGAAMVEYRHDPATGRSVLMEINGRFWGSLPLAYHAGAPFVWLTYSILGKGEEPALAPYRTGLRCGSLVPELKRLHRILARPDLIQNRQLRFSRLGSVADFLANQLSPFRRHYVFSWSDPMPAIADLWLGLVETIGRRG